MKITFFAVAISAAIISGCGNAGNQSMESDKMRDSLIKSNAHTVSPFTSPVYVLLQIYLKMKNELVNDNDKKAAKAGNELVKALDNFDQAILREEEKKPFEGLADDSKKHAQNIAMNAGNIKYQREHFDTLSKDMYDMVTRFAAGESIYLDYCPMYKNNKGALWLSEAIEIRNPYFGSAMLTCGKTTETIQ